MGARLSPPVSLRRPASLLVLLLSAVIAAGLSCGYSPNFANDTLQCGAGSTCPKGYSCATDSKCWKNGELATDAGTHVDTGTGGDTHGDVGIGTDPRLPFVGTWTFNAGTLSGTCSDSPTPVSQPLSGDFMVVSLAGTGLSAQYFCDAGWNLDLPTGTNTTVVRTGQMCTFRTTASGITTAYMFSGLAFSLMTSNGLSATFAAHFTGPFSASDGTSGTCNFTLSGQLTKT